MISHCANPECKGDFMHTPEGELFIIQVPDHVPEYHWLCPPCAVMLHVVHDPSVGMRLTHAPIHHGLDSVAVTGITSVWSRQRRLGEIDLFLKIKKRPGLIESRGAIV